MRTSAPTKIMPRVCGSVLVVRQVFFFFPPLAIRQNVFFFANDVLERMFENFGRLQDSGRGSYGCVKTGRHRVTRKFCAIKTFLSQTNQSGIPTDVVREIACLKQMSSEYVLKIYDVRCDGQISIILEGMQRNMKQHYNTHDTTEHFGWHATQILRGLSHIHSHHWIHRDIKPQNILINDRQHVKICDMGQATFHRPGFLKTMDQIGTTWYRAPELYSRHNYDYKVDVWSAGCTLVEMATKLPLFGEEEGKIPALQMKYSKEGSDLVEKTAIQLPCIHDFLEHSPHRRKSSACLVTHLEALQSSLVVPSSPLTKKKIKDNLLSSPSSLFDNQTELNENMRHVLIDWLMTICFEFKLQTPVIESTVYILDLFMAETRILRSAFQKYGVACMLLACKYEHAHCGIPTVQDFVYISDDAFTESELLSAEVEVWNSVQHTMPLFTIGIFTEPYTLFRNVWLFSESRFQHDSVAVDDACRRISTKDALITRIDDKLCRLLLRVPPHGLVKIHGKSAFEKAIGTARDWKRNTLSLPF